jgi:hypothetical protein
LLQKNTRIADEHSKILPETIVSLKWIVFKLCHPAHLFPNTPRTCHILTENNAGDAVLSCKTLVVCTYHILTNNNAGDAGLSCKTLVLCTCHILTENNAGDAVLSC